MRLYKLYTLLGFLLLILTITQFLLEVYFNDEEWTQSQVPWTNSEESLEDVTDLIVLWWTPLGGPTLHGRVHRCGQFSCYFTSDRRFQHHPLIKMLVFYGSNMKLSDMPLPRLGTSVKWALLHEESPRNNMAVTHLPLLSLFNHTATVSRHSSFPMTTQFLRSLGSLTDKKYFVPTTVKSRLQREENLAPVIYLQSDCSTSTDRDSYVAELAKYISVDSYGDCLHNRDLPPRLQSPNRMETMMSEELLHLVAKYKFTLAIENGVCHDYITEKLWRPLVAGSVPVYIGSPTISDWLPNSRSAVLGLDFPTPRELAEHLQILNSNDSLYQQYLSHKLESDISNSLLVDTMRHREWKVEASAGETDFLQSFNCFLCEKAHQSEQSVATQDHYRCPVPESILSRSPNTTNFWLDEWFRGRCEAEVVRQFVDAGVSDQAVIEKALDNLIFDNKCSYSKDNMNRITRDIL